jgi:hypothetical protein
MTVWRTVGRERFECLTFVGWRNSESHGKLVAKAAEDSARYAPRDSAFDFCKSVLIEEYNHDRPHRGVENRIPQEAFLAFAVLTKNEALNV